MMGPACGQQGAEEIHEGLGEGISSRIKDKCCRKNTGGHFSPSLLRTPSQAQAAGSGAPSPDHDQQATCTPARLKCSTKEAASPALHAG